jgi:hypothetical protein
MKCFRLPVLVTGFIFCQCVLQAQTLYTDVLVAGGGTGGVAAGIQAARQKVKTIIVEPTPWLGGMLTTAGVSATDGNHNLPSGLWEEFRQALYVHYGTKNLATGWVSNTLFEPHVGDSILKAFCQKEAAYLTVLHGYTLTGVTKNGKQITALRFLNQQNEPLTIQSKIAIDATELGDVMALSQTAFDMGTEDPAATGEALAPGKTGIIQDLTYAAILKDYGPGAGKTIARPEGYDSSRFFKSCLSKWNTDTGITKTTAEKMLQYGKIRNGKYMINWPPHGNDTYLNVINSTSAERLAAYEKAKNTTLQFVYFIQKDLGFKNLGIANDEFNTPDGLPYIPYNRESRRLRGLVRLTLNDIQQPFSQSTALYKTGISVGDYPIDHHHDKNPAMKKIKFPPVPSYNIPLGALIPQQTDGLIVAEKSISVSNLANGTTRLQPVALLTGQAAGALAAQCILKKIQPRNAMVREVQQQLLNSGCYIMPYVDVNPTDTAWQAIQKAGALGIIKGTGKPEAWANKTYFYPDSILAAGDLLQAVSQLPHWTKQQPRTMRVAGASSVGEGWNALVTWQHYYWTAIGTPHKYPPIAAFELKEVLRKYYPGKEFTGTEPLTRRLFAILLNELASRPFDIPVSFKGDWMRK